MNLKYIFMASAVSLFPLAAHADPIKLCTGLDTGKYYSTGNKLLQNLKGLVDIQVVTTNGSEDNLRRIDSGECQLAIVQSDAHFVYAKQNPKSSFKLERVAPLYPEYVHFLCNKESGVTKIKDLYDTKNKVLIGPPGSGTAITWAAFGQMEKRYLPIPTESLGGQRALSRVINNQDASCMMYVAGIGSQAMKDVNEFAKGKGLRLVTLNDGDLDNAKGPDGKPIYHFSEIPGGTYYELQYGMFSTAVKTISMDAVLVANTDWVDKNESAYTRLSKEALRLSNQLQ